MNSRQPSQYFLTIFFPSHRLATRRMLRERAVELAMISGRSSLDVAKCDWEQAKEELTRRSDAEREVPGPIIFASWTQQRSENHD